jgi:hypothetical protein
VLALELSVVEAVTNSIEHAFSGPPGVVRLNAGLNRDGTVGVEITDDGRWKPPRADPGFRGRGLVMMREFSDTLRLVTSDDGTTVSLAKGLRRPVFTDDKPSAQRVERYAGEGDIQLDIDVGPDAVVVSVAGVVDSSSVDELHACLVDAERRGWLPLTVVLDGVTLLASAGLRTLYEFAGALLSSKRPLRLVAADASPVRASCPSAAWTPSSTSARASAVSSRSDLCGAGAEPGRGAGSGSGSPAAGGRTG